MAWPTTSDPRTEFVTLRLTVGESADLDWLCSQVSQSRSEATRDALAEKVARERAKQVKQQARKTKKNGKAKG